MEANILYGAPEEIRTHAPLFRRQEFYFVNKSCKSIRYIKFSCGINK
jgi:hypothetical protein